MGMKKCPPDASRNGSAQYGVRRWNRRFGLKRSVKSSCAVSIAHIGIHTLIRTPCFPKAVTPSPHSKMALQPDLPSRSRPSAIESVEPVTGPSGFREPSLRSLRSFAAKTHNSARAQFGDTSRQLCRNYFMICPTEVISDGEHKNCWTAVTKLLALRA